MVLVLFGLVCLKLFLTFDHEEEYISTYFYKKEDVQNGNSYVMEDYVPEYITEEEGLPWSDTFEELDDGTWHDFEVDRVIPPVLNSKESAEKQKLPFILWWTPFTGQLGRIKRCSLGDCFISQNRSIFSHQLTQAFLFYGTEFDVKDLPLPRETYHEWALLHEESPKNQAIFYHEEAIALFNHTSTFKQQSSYPISTQYINSADYLLKPPPFDVDDKNRIKEAEGLASIAYIQSGCNPPSDRDTYVQELMKYIKIDSYGRCLHNKDLPDKLKNPLTMFDKGYLEFIGRYKFIISFENARCNDYMTEKIFRTMHVGAVPIYMGASNLREWLPDPHSVVMVDDFDSPEQLAKHIQYLDDNNNEYKKLLQYKKTEIKNMKLKTTLEKRKWGINTSRKLNYITALECYVCDQLHNNRIRQTEGKTPQISIASQEHYGCPKPVLFPFPSTPGTEDWERKMWLWEYDEGKKKAINLKNKVLNHSKSNY